MVNDFRFGYIAGIYYEARGDGKLPKQMELIDTWFPELVVQQIPSDNQTKIPAEYADPEYRIRAVKVHGRLYSGGASARISQILGRLTGTAGGNQEKERRTAVLIQKHLADCFVNDMDLTPDLKENTASLLSQLTEEQRRNMHTQLCNLVYELADWRCSMPDYDRKTEPFSMDDEVFDGVIYNAAYQLTLSSFSGLCNAYLWLLTGSLLRNESGRVLRFYDSAFIAVRRQLSETGTLRDKLDYLFHPGTFRPVYSGTDVTSRFPDVEWYCDGEGCGAHLNEQEGFDDRLPEWKCEKCGYRNRLGFEDLYGSEEDWINRKNPADPQQFYDAVLRRKREMDDLPQEKTGKDPPTDK